MIAYYCIHDRPYLTRSEATNCMHYQCWPHRAREWNAMNHVGQRKGFNQVRGH